MTLVVEADGTVCPASLARAVPDSPSFHGLDRVGQKLARGIGEFLRSLMAVPATISVAAIRIEESPRTEAMVVRHLRLAPLEGVVDIAVDRPALMTLVDLYYGGEGGEVGQRERLSPAEAHFFTRIARGFCDLLPAAWQSFAAIGARLDDDADGKTGPIAIQVFSISLADSPAFEIECRYPVRMIEAIPGLQSAAPVAADALSDQNWQAQLMDSALQVAFPVRAVFAEPELPLARLMRLRAGDIIPVCLPSQIELTVAGLRLARGTAGESNGRAAICIEHF